MKNIFKIYELYSKLHLSVVSVIVTDTQLIIQLFRMFMLLEKKERKNVENNFVAVHVSICICIVCTHTHEAVHKLYSGHVKCHFEYVIHRTLCFEYIFSAWYYRYSLCGRASASSKHKMVQSHPHRCQHLNQTPPIDELNSNTNTHIAIFVRISDVRI